MIAWRLLKVGCLMGSFLYLFFSEYPTKLSQGVILSYSKSFFFAYHQMTTWSALWEGLTVNIFDRSDSLTKKKGKTKWIQPRVTNLYFLVTSSRALLKIIKKMVRNIKWPHFVVESLYMNDMQHLTSWSSKFHLRKIRFLQN